MERSLAVVEAGIVSNIIVVDSSDQTTIDHFGGLLLPDGSPVAIGWSYANGAFSAPAVPAPTQAEQFKAIERAFDKRMDEEAQSHGYDSSVSCRLYAGYPNPFQAEATAFGQWVANTWVLAFQQQQDVVAGIRPMPSVETAVAEIPAMVWP